MSDESLLLLAGCLLLQVRALTNTGGFHLLPLFPVLYTGVCLSGRDL